MEQHDEYQALRREILDWQNRRQQIMTFSSATATVMLGWITSKSSDWSWTIASSVVITFLSVTYYLAWLSDRIKIRISTYIQVFHEECEEVRGWETRSQALRRFRSLPHFHTLATVVYLIYGAVAITVSCLVCRKPVSDGSVVLFTLVTLLFLVVLVVSGIMSYPSGVFVQAWRVVQSKELCGSDKNEENVQQPPERDK